MKTKKSELVFGIRAVVELQNDVLLSVNGGTIVTVNITELTRQITCGGGEDSCVTR
ncbi:hypothetical protein [Lacinutrix sp. Hel_I_90]|uniref:hypothetical protein n=1 Tax=Lacinutrix sp. Hel_I_90 TaxID=1249999 RepID=UPI000A516DE5|nr:hypothetical protein [Lacinutrix sp. Hel_I_90]